jgi:two-component sensor histidine kinase
MATIQIDTTLLKAMAFPAGILHDDGHWIELNAQLTTLEENDSEKLNRFKLALLGNRWEKSSLVFQGYQWEIKPMSTERLWLVQSWPMQVETNMALHQEVFHRVKNNLAMIESLLYLQKMLTKDEIVSSILDDCEKRIHSMILVHVNLCHSLESDMVDMQQYLEQLIRYLMNSFGSQGKFDVETSISKIELPSDKAVALGLIVNELVTNSFKYGLSSTYNPTLKISLQLNEHGTELIVADNGPGFEKLPGNEDNKSLGLMLVRMLCRDLNGKLELANEKGAKAKLIF